MQKVKNYLEFLNKGILKKPYGSQKKQKVNMYSFKLPEIDFLKTSSYNLPKKYLDLVNNAVFAIPPKTHQTIDFLFNSAQFQLSGLALYSGYDTSIRESLMEIGHQMIDKAIMLIADYWYDPKTQYYMRRSQNNDNEFDIHSFQLRKIIIYQYWSNKTGRGLQSFKASINTSSKVLDHYFYYEILNYEKAQEDLLMKQLYLELKNEDPDFNNIGDVIESNDFKLSKYKCSYEYLLDNSLEYLKSTLEFSSMENVKDLTAKTKVWQKLYDADCIYRNVKIQSIKEIKD